MLELLISVLLIAIGALALAQMRVNGMRLTSNASDRLRAVWLAESMAERMRANPAGVANDEYLEPVPSTLQTCATYCDSSAVVHFHQQRWNREMQEILPGAVGIVCRDDTPTDSEGRSGTPTDWQCSNTGERYAIKVWWQELLLQDDTPSSQGGESIAIVFDWPGPINLSGP